ncbi:long-chain fatty acid--CoA ligase [Candidatus Cyanaurora vandensis]|uniref:long-chain-fatty-acid--CoA ligase n=1 Tax=Candidatus Cyanaurora vandensis TaxID=2714958 RepID=UPI0025806158|nr:long-chain fatty acid--CoA ligase [Candidatus Cyanaurora vandensis]
MANLSRFLLQSAQRYPDRIAFQDDQATLTYQQLDQQSQALAQALQVRGVGVGSRVALILPNVLAYPVAAYALWRLGAQAVLVNPQLTGPELQFILADSSSTVALVIGPVVPVLASQRPHLPQLTTVIGVGATPDQPVDAHWQDLLQTAVPTPLAPPSTHSDDICAILYTSGTTGRPKGAQLSHGNLAANAQAGITLMRITEADRGFCILPLFHAFAFTCALVIIPSVGGTAVLAAKFAPRQLMQQLMDPDLTILLAVPSLLATLLKFPPTFKFGAKFRCILCGGAALFPALEDAFRQRFQVPVLQGYGATECSPLAACNPLYGLQKPGSIGPAMPEGHELAIMDPDQERFLDVGEIGELVVRGPHVFHGYLNQPEATAKTFTRQGWLRTGDLARRDADDYFFVVDRIKDMINVSGEKVFSSEVELILQSYPGIQESAVVGAPDPGKGEVVVAYVTLTDKELATNPEAKAQFVDQLLQYCRTQLAQFKVPRQIEILEDFPRSAAGKILKRVLRQQLAPS